ncbi:hypothetical protein OIU74_022776 [Salix koriyanagi]|uniref:Uncharacterized protein n=1 Tax=Salix koriyanagi TaxID=2511006 RepID=A0A9Q0WL97_9ROSI|nr:hypothetical protein OIU74_022776 [Salix koriyanagi]
MNAQLNHSYSKRRGCISVVGASRRSLWSQFSNSYDRCNLELGKCIGRLRKFMNSSEKMRKHVSSTLFTRFVVSVLMVSFAVSNSPSCEFSIPMPKIRGGSAKSCSETGCLISVVF